MGGCRQGWRAPVKMPGLPIADALISEQAAGLSTAVASDDYDLRALGAKPVWYKR